MVLKYIVIASVGFSIRKLVIIPLEGSFASSIIKSARKNDKHEATNK